MKKLNIIPQDWYHGGTLLQIKKMRVYEWYLYMVYTKKNKSGVGAHAHNMYNVDPSLVLIDVLQF
jgi:hypothetical protein